MKRPPLIRTVAASAAALGLLAACGGDDEDSTDTTSAATADAGTTAATASADTTAGDGTTAGSAAESGIEVTDAWARQSPAMASAGAMYMTIQNNGSADDALLGASVDASVAGTVEVHETTTATSDTGMATGTSDAMHPGTTAAMGDGTMASGSMPGGDMMQMRPVDRVDIPAGEQVALEPGGYHIMLLDLAAPLEVGDTIEVTLDFETAPDVTLDVEVRESAP